MGIYLRISLITIIAAMLLTGVTMVTLSGQMVEAKTKSYQLTVYLDNAFKPNHLPSFKVVVYNSDDKQILSEKVTPDFTDTHQTISPEPGYEIAYKSKQYPSQIKVCAQESYSENGKIKTHDDCFPIQQDKAKTYWYTIIDYPLIEEFEVNEDEGT
jgi:predicted RND superfamily exporter protein